MRDQTIPVHKNCSYTIEIKQATLEGIGLGKIEGYTVFVKGAIPGEHVRISIIKVASSYAVGRIEEVLSASPWRVAPACPYYKKCGGCSFQHVSYEGQLNIKQKAVTDCMQRIGGFYNCTVNPVLPSPKQWRYRNKGSFPCGKTSDDRIAFGFFSPRSHTLIQVDDCLLETSTVMNTIGKISDWANTEKIPPYNEGTGKGILRHAVIRETSAGDVMCTLVCNSTPTKEKTFITKLSSATSLFWNVNKEQTNVIFGKKFIHLYGEMRLNESICNNTYQISPPSFLQVNHDQTELLYHTAIDMLKPKQNEIAYDLYCGMGSISLFLSRFVKKVIGIETVSEAIEDAKTNAIENMIENAEFYCGNVEDHIEYLCKKIPPDIIVLDPPRKGCEKSVLQAINISGCKRLVYISCNPATLARDLKILCQTDIYKVETIQPVDMFPQTGHVETVALVSRHDL